MKKESIEPQQVIYSGKPLFSLDSSVYLSFLGDDWEKAMALEEGKQSSSVLQVAVSGWEKQRNLENGLRWYIAFVKSDSVVLVLPS